MSFRCDAFVRFYMLFFAFNSNFDLVTIYSVCFSVSVWKFVQMKRATGCAAKNDLQNCREKRLKLRYLPMELNNATQYVKRSESSFSKQRDRSYPCWNSLFNEGRMKMKKKSAFHFRYTYFMAKRHACMPSVQTVNRNWS